MHVVYEYAVAILVTLTGLLTPAPEFAPEQIAEQASSIRADVVTVIDGDTIDVLIDGERERVRYIGIDAPEAAHRGSVAECYADAATAANAALVSGNAVLLVRDERDRDDYDRLLRYVYVDEVFVNEALVADGAARSMTIPPDTAYEEEFVAAEDAARAAGVGLWDTCTQ